MFSLNIKHPWWWTYTGYSLSQLKKSFWAPACVLQKGKWGQFYLFLFVFLQTGWKSRSWLCSLPTLGWSEWANVSSGAANGFWWICLWAWWKPCIFKASIHQGFYFLHKIQALSAWLLMKDPRLCSKLKKQTKKKNWHKTCRFLNGRSVVCWEHNVAHMQHWPSFFTTYFISKGTTILTG